MFTKLNINKILVLINFLYSFVTLEGLIFPIYIDPISNNIKVNITIDRNQYFYVTLDTSTDNLYIVDSECMACVEKGNKFNRNLCPSFKITGTEMSLNSLNYVHRPIISNIKINNNDISIEYGLLIGKLKNSYEIIDGLFGIYLTKNNKFLNYLLSSTYSKDKKTLIIDLSNKNNKELIIGNSDLIKQTKYFCDSSKYFKFSCNLNTIATNEKSYEVEYRLYLSTVSFYTFIPENDFNSIFERELNALGMCTVELIFNGNDFIRSITCNSTIKNISLDEIFFVFTFDNLIIKFQGLDSLFTYNPKEDTYTLIFKSLRNIKTEIILGIGAIKNIGTILNYETSQLGFFGDNISGYTKPESAEAIAYRKLLIISICVSVSLILIIACCIGYVCYNRRKRRNMRERLM